MARKPAATWSKITPLRQVGMIPVLDAPWIFWDQTQNIHALSTHIFRIIIIYTYHVCIIMHTYFRDHLSISYSTMKVAIAYLETYRYEMYISSSTFPFSLCSAHPNASPHHLLYPSVDQHFAWHEWFISLWPHVAPSWGAKMNWSRKSGIQCPSSSTLHSIELLQSVPSFGHFFVPFFKSTPRSEPLNISKFVSHLFKLR